MTLLVVSPDYASHVLPLATLATAWRDAGERVVVATGPATAAVVEAFGLERVDLRLGRGSNPGVIRADEQPVGEDDNLRAFFAATRRGMVATLRYQAEARRTDLLWEPELAGRRVLEIVDQVAPDQVLVDHLAFGATLGLRAGSVPYGDVVLGHPTALPVDGEVYGYPTAWPAAIDADPAGLDELHRRCCEVRDEFTDRWNAALRSIAPDAEPVADAFAVHGDLVLFNHPLQLHDPARTERLPRHVFLGASIRADAPDAEVAEWLDRDAGRPLVYVSFGSFLSERADVLAVVAEALRGLDVRVALATGVADSSRLGVLPADWLVRAVLPQVALLGRAAAAVTHGGNNSITECLAAGVPMVVLPFSTDQFAGAAAVVDHGVGLALSPNDVSPRDVAQAVDRLLGGPCPAVASTVAAELAARPGSAVAFDAMTDAGFDR